MSTSLGDHILDHEDLEDVRRCLPLTRDRVGPSIHYLACWLKGRHPEPDLKHREAIFRLWFARSRELVGESDEFDRSWLKFEKYYSEVTPFQRGQTESMAKEARPFLEVPESIRGSGKDGVVRVAQAFIALRDVNAMAGRLTFHAPYGLIAEVAGLDRRNTKSVERAAEWLHSAGHLSRVSPGERGRPNRHRVRKASEWQWFDEPSPGTRMWALPEEQKRGKDTAKSREESEDDRLEGLPY